VGGAGWVWETVEGWVRAETEIVEGVRGVSGRRVMGGGGEEGSGKGRGGEEGCEIKGAGGGGECGEVVRRVVVWGRGGMGEVWKNVVGWWGGKG